MPLREILALLDAAPDPPLGRLIRGEPYAPACAALRAAGTGDPAVLAGLWTAADGFTEAHGLAQDLDGAEGAWWHAILHRREPDAANALYWYRRVRPPLIIILLAWSLEAVS